MATKGITINSPNTILFGIVPTLNGTHDHCWRILYLFNSESAKRLTLPADIRMIFYASPVSLYVYSPNQICLLYSLLTKLQYCGTITTVSVPASIYSIPLIGGKDDIGHFILKLFKRAELCQPPNFVSSVLSKCHDRAPPRCCMRVARINSIDRRKENTTGSHSDLTLSTDSMTIYI